MNAFQQGQIAFSLKSGVSNESFRIKQGDNLDFEGNFESIEDNLYQVKPDIYRLKDYDLGLIIKIQLKQSWDSELSELVFDLVQTNPGIKMCSITIPKIKPMVLSVDALKLIRGSVIMHIEDV